MNRRQFTGALAGVAAAQTARPANGENPHWLLLESFQLRQGDQVARMHDYLKSWIPKAPAGPKLILEAVIAPHTPQLLAIAGVNNFEDIRWTQASIALSLDALGKTEPLFDALNVTVLEAAAFSPEITPAKSETPRYFELRMYHAPTMPQLKALHGRFRGSEVGIFHRSGIHPLFYASTVIGANMMNLTYLIPFDSLAAREKAWAAFSADPDWIKARNESIEKFGQIVSVSDIAIYRATPYSPIS